MLVIQKENPKQAQGASEPMRDNRMSQKYVIDIYTLRIEWITGQVGAGHGWKQSGKAKNQECDTMMLWIWNKLWKKKMKFYTSYFVYPKWTQYKSFMSAQAKCLINLTTATLCYDCNNNEHQLWNCLHIHTAATRDCHTLPTADMQKRTAGDSEEQKLSLSSLMNITTADFTAQLLLLTWLTLVNFIWRNGCIKTTEGLKSGRTARLPSQNAATTGMTPIKWEIAWTEWNKGDFAKRRRVCRGKPFQ